jgi:hypothetical protein
MEKIRFTGRDLHTVRCMYNNNKITKKDLIKAEKEGVIVKIAEAGDYKGAYLDFMRDESIYADAGINITFSTFMQEFKKGYGKSSYVQIARLFELSNGVWYDNEYVG